MHVDNVTLVDGVKCPRQESNLRPSVPETGALSAELRGRRAGNPRQSRLPGASRLAIAAAVASVALVALAGCGSPDKGEPAATGTVTVVVDSGDPLVFTLSTEPQNSLNNAVITVAARDLEGATPEEVKRGDEVKVWAQVCTQSIPAQCQATSVEVTGK